MKSLFAFVLLLSGLINAQEMPTFFIGHKSPDTDAIMSAIVAASLYGGIPARAGEINPETRYLLQRFALPEPILITSATNKRFFLVDFNQRSQGIDGLSGKNIVGIIDHHAVQKDVFDFSEPIDIIIRRVGCTCTILFSQFNNKNIAISQSMAGAMLGAIISDTLNLRSPTTAQDDRDAVKALANIANISDVDLLAHEMFAAKSAIDHIGVDELILLDYKEFQSQSIKYGIAVIETIAPNGVASRTPAIVDALLKAKGVKSLDYLFFAIIDSDHLTSQMIAPSAAERKVLSELNFVQIGEYTFDTKGLISRKLQFVPLIEGYLRQLNG